MKILVPLDGSDLAEEALSTGLALAAAHEAELHLVSVVSYVPPVPMALADEAMISGWIEGEQARMREYLEGAARKASSDPADVSVQAHVRVGRVSSTVQQVADELDADLLVMTTHGRGAFQRSWLGSVADELVRQVERPILLLSHREPGRWAFDPDALDHVLVPLDGSEAAECALDPLPLILPPSGSARVTLACVIEEGYTIPPVYIPKSLTEEGLREQHRSQTEAYLQRVADRLNVEGVGTVETRVLVDDSPTQGLLRFLDEVGVQLVSISTHGRGGVSRLFLGSVADKLIRRSPVPLLVSRRPEEQ